MKIKYFVDSILYWGIVLIVSLFQLYLFEWKIASIGLVTYGIAAIMLLAAIYITYVDVRRYKEAKYFKRI